jgi:signal transduction histidine kinase
MAERIQTAGGSLEITSEPGGGTRVVLRLPA